MEGSIAFIKGFLTSGSLIIAIGSQNAFVIRQGLLKNNIFIVTLICIICDSFLIFIGVYGVGGFVKENTLIMLVLSSSGALFLMYYGFLSFKAACQGVSTLEISKISDSVVSKRVKTVIATFAVSLLNPHVYMDTVVIIGGLASVLPSYEKRSFAIGALLASSIWFVLLSYAASKLTPLLTNPKTWKIINMIIAIIMWAISVNLIMYIFDKMVI